MRTFFLATSILFFTTACQQEHKIDTQTTTKPITKKVSTTQVESKDSVEADKNPAGEIIPQKDLKRSEDKPIVLPEAIDVDFHIYDPFEDPNYIGTPCGDYINGRCSRHRHHKNEPDYEDEIKDVFLDSL